MNENAKIIVMAVLVSIQFGLLAGQIVNAMQPVHSSKATSIICPVSIVLLSVAVSIVGLVG